MALEIEVGVEGRNYFRINHETLRWLVHTATDTSTRRGNLPTINSQVTRLNEKLEVVSMGLRQPNEG